MRSKVSAGRGLKDGQSTMNCFNSKVVCCRFVISERTSGTSLWVCAFVTASHTGGSQTASSASTGMRACMWDSSGIK